MDSSQYNKLLHSSRKEELSLRLRTLNNTITLLKEVDISLEAAIAQAANQTGTLRKEQLQAMKAKVDRDLDNFQEAYTEITRQGVAGEAGLILKRNGQIFLEVEGTQKLIDTLQDKVLSQIMQYKEKDGLVLSDRVWRLTQEAKADITARISQGILLGESHVKVAKDLKRYLVGSGGMRYKTERLTMTEMAKAYQLANQQSVDMMRQNSEYMWFEKWELSPAHPRPDVCDILATQDEGEGPGIYEVSPNRHPGCYCYIYPVYRLKRVTDVTYPSVSTKEPDLADMKPSDYKQAKELTN